MREECVRLAMMSSYGAGALGNDLTGFDLRRGRHTCFTRPTCCISYICNCSRFWAVSASVWPCPFTVALRSVLRFMAWNLFMIRRGLLRLGSLLTWSPSCAMPCRRCCCCCCCCCCDLCFFRTSWCLCGPIQSVASNAPRADMGDAGRIPATQDEVGTFPNSVAFRIMEEDLGVPPQEVFEFIYPDPIASASIGQVSQRRRSFGRNSRASFVCLWLRFCRHLQRGGVCSEIPRLDSAKRSKKRTDAILATRNMSRATGYLWRLPAHERAFRSATFSDVVVVVVVVAAVALFSIVIMLLLMVMLVMIMVILLMFGVMGLAFRR